MVHVTGSAYTIVQTEGVGRFDLVAVATGRVVVSMSLQGVDLALAADSLASVTATFVVTEADHPMIEVA